MNKQLEDIKAIRDTMERSSRFLSLSGISGIVAGITAIAGTILIYPVITLAGAGQSNISFLGNEMSVASYIVLIASCVLAIAISTGLYFSSRKAAGMNQKLVNKVSLRALYSMAIPLATGGIIAILCLMKAQYGLLIPVTLLFYGLALVNVSKMTYDEVHYLGLTELVLGIAAAILVVLFGAYREALICWALGFGMCHIIYGSKMYIKYDLKK